MRRLEQCIGADFDGRTVEEVARRVMGLSRHALTRAKYLEDGILLDGVRVRSNTHVYAGQMLDIAIGDGEEACAAGRVEAIAGPVDVVYEDADIIVVNKPAGIVMYPYEGIGEPTLGNYIMYHLAGQFASESGERRPAGCTSDSALAPVPTPATTFATSATSASTPATASATSATSASTSATVSASALTPTLVVREVKGAAVRVHAPAPAVTPATASASACALAAASDSAATPPAPAPAPVAVPAATSAAVYATASAAVLASATAPATAPTTATAPATATATAPTTATAPAPDSALAFPSAPSCRLHPVHRLDRGTSGLVVFAKNAHAQHILQKSLHTDSFVREYVALCHNAPPAVRGAIDAPIARAGYRPARFCVRGDGKPARTHYEVERTFTDATGRSLSLVRLRLETGRTHQIRVHLSSLGCPLLGDGLYGGSTRALARPALHSARLVLVHPITHERVELTSELPDDLMSVCH